MQRGVFEGVQTPFFWYIQNVRLWIFKTYSLLNAYHSHLSLIGHSLLSGDCGQEVEIAAFHQFSK